MSPYLRHRDNNYLRTGQHLRERDTVLSWMWHSICTSETQCLCDRVTVSMSSRIYVIQERLSIWVSVTQYLCDRDNIDPRTSHYQCDRDSLTRAYRRRHRYEAVSSVTCDLFIPPVPDGLYLSITGGELWYKQSGYGDILHFVFDYGPGCWECPFFMDIFEKCTLPFHSVP